MSLWCLLFGHDPRVRKGEKRCRTCGKLLRIVQRRDEDSEE